MALRGLPEAGLRARLEEGDGVCRLDELLPVSLLVSGEPMDEFDTLRVLRPRGLQGAESGEDANSSAWRPFFLGSKMSILCAMIDVRDLPLP